MWVLGRCVRFGWRGRSCLRFRKFSETEKISMRLGNRLTDNTSRGDFCFSYCLDIIECEGTEVK
jgi:hypothetical protein